MKDIKDYLHLYLGCECFNHLRLLGVEGNAAYVSHPATGRMVKDINYIKPILRPLSDMTEEEVLELCKTASPTIFGDYRFAKWEAKRSPHEMCHWTVTNKNSTYRFNVSSIDGDVYISDEDGWIDLVYIDGNYRFWYLKKGFDLFGLIDAGLAIDITKLNNKP